MVTNGTLLGAVRENNPIPWDDDFDVMMTPESYEKLKQLFPKNCLDGMNDEKYPLVIPKFVPDKDKYLKSSIFVDIFLVVPTNKKQVRHFRSLIQKTNFSLQAIHSSWKPYAWYISCYKYLSWPAKIFIQKMTYKKAVSFLSTNQPDFYYTIDNPIDPFKINVIPNLTFKVTYKKFSNFKVPVPIEYDQILKLKYGDYMVPNRNQRPFVHINAVSIAKVKKQK